VFRGLLLKEREGRGKGKMIEKRGDEGAKWGEKRRGGEERGGEGGSSSFALERKKKTQRLCTLLDIVRCLLYMSFCLSVRLSQVGSSIKTDVWIELVFREAFQRLYGRPNRSHITYRSNMASCCKIFHNVLYAYVGPLCI